MLRESTETAAGPDGLAELLREAADLGVEGLLEGGEDAEALNEFFNGLKERLGKAREAMRRKLSEEDIERHKNIVRAVGNYPADHPVHGPDETGHYTASDHSRKKWHKGYETRMHHSQAEETHRSYRRYGLLAGHGGG